VAIEEVYIEYLDRMLQEMLCEQQDKTKGVEMG
jgi:hypothetical protein